MRDLGKGKIPFIYSHLKFDVLYNGDRVIHATVTGDKEIGFFSFLLFLFSRNNHLNFSLFFEIALEGDDLLIEFSFSVNWQPTDIQFEHRLDYLKNEKLFPHELEIHWLSILNSFVLVVLLSGFVVVILLRILKSDLIRYHQSKESGDDTEDYGIYPFFFGDEKKSIFYFIYRFLVVPKTKKN